MLKLTILSADGAICSTVVGKNTVSLLYQAAYRSGDTIHLENDSPGCGWYAVIQLEDSLAPTLVYLPKGGLTYRIPEEAERIVFSPKAFSGEKHLVRARFATPEELAARRNLAFNCYDRHGSNGFYPHSSANVETRGEVVFASYNAIDGVYENSSHGGWPYQSWGINRDPNAALRLEFGRPVCLDEQRLTLRADFPHDSWWTSAAVEFSDGSREVLSLRKSAIPQCFAITQRTVTWLLLTELIKAEDESPFPALTQLEAWGTEARLNQE